MSAIAEFWDEPLTLSVDLEAFLRKYDSDQREWIKLKNRAMEILTEKLKREIPPIHVTGRVKERASLRKRLYERYRAHQGKLTEEMIFSDAEPWDFVGLRIAMYFPNQQGKVLEAIQEAFEEEESLRKSTRTRPSPEDNDHQSHQRRFPGYEGRHYWARFRTKDESAGRHGQQLFEIQLRSVMMDSWDAIGHDLEYKTLTGILSKDERKIMDSIKGLAITGEVLLEHLYEIHQRRMGSDGVLIENNKGLRQTLKAHLGTNPSLEESLSYDNKYDNALFTILRAAKITTLGALKVTLKKLDLGNKLEHDYETWKTEWKKRPHPHAEMYPNAEKFLLYTILQHIPDHKKDDIWQNAISIRLEDFKGSRGLQNSTPDPRKDYSTNVIWCILSDFSDVIYFDESRTIIPGDLEIERLSALWYASAWLGLHPKKFPNVALISALTKPPVSNAISSFEFDFQSCVLSCKGLAREAPRSRDPRRSLLYDSLVGDIGPWKLGYKRFEQILKEISSQPEFVKDGTPVEPTLQKVHWESLKLAIFLEATSILLIEIEECRNIDAKIVTKEEWKNVLCDLDWMIKEIESYHMENDITKRLSQELVSLANDLKLFGEEDAVLDDSEVGRRLYSYRREKFEEREGRKPGPEEVIE